VDGAFAAGERRKPTWYSPENKALWGPRQTSTWLRTAECENAGVVCYLCATCRQFQEIMG
jgi:hypothetical protein